MQVRSANYGLLNMNQRVNYVLQQRGMNAYLCTPEAQICLARGLDPRNTQALSSCVSEQQMIAIQSEQLELQRQEAYDRERRWEETQRNWKRQDDARDHHK